MEIIVTTGDLKYAYSIIQPIFVQISNKGVLKNQYDHLELKYKEVLHDLQEKGILPKEEHKKRGTIAKAHEQTSSTGHKMEKAFYLALEEIKNRAKQLGGQAVVYMRYETDFLDSLPDEFYLQMYGTAVKFEA
jgi:hypothetical protein